MTDRAPWNEAEGRLLVSLLDEIIPASADGRVPAAGTLGVAEFLAGRAAADPSLVLSICEALTHAAKLADAQGATFEALDAAGRVAVVETLQREVPDAFTVLLRHTYMGYYSRPDVRPHFGLSDRPTQPEGYAVPDDDPDEMAALLAPVRTRGRCYRGA